MSRQKSDDCLWTSFKKEFHLENFSLNFERNSQFLKKEPEEVLEYYHTTIWPCCNRLVYLIYRIAIAIYYTIWFIESIIRNAEFISKGIKIKSKLKLFSIHPWPLYMTSWSLTILFAHLWIAAFISLYFYSINEGSCLAAIFTQIFGPFSCSRGSPQNRNATTKNKNTKRHLKSCFTGMKFRNFLFKQSSNNINNKNIENCDCTHAKITLQNNEQNATASDAELGGNQVILLQNTQIDTNSKSFKNPHRTYCINKSHCNIPSAIVISNSYNWKLWIDTHVPNFVLILIKISWLLNNLVAISALIVTCLYLGYANIVDLEAEPTWAHELGNWHRHGINSLVALVDVIMLGYPIRILHFVYVIIYGWVYAVVTFVYWFQDPKKHILYDTIDYKNPFKMMLYYVCLTILVFLMQITHFLAYRLKVLIRMKYFDNKECQCIIASESVTPVSDITDSNLNSETHPEIILSKA